MRKGDESRQRLIQCAAELFWRNGYVATGIQEILKETGLPKGSFYFYFKSKDELAVAVTSYYQELILQRLQELAQGRSWEAFIEKAFAFLMDNTEAGRFEGCPFAVLGMETACSKPEIAAAFMEKLWQFQKLFCDVLQQSGIPMYHAKVLSERILAVYQGEFLLGRISGDISYMKKARTHMLEMYREYREVYQI